MDTAHTATPGIVILPTDTITSVSTVDIIANITLRITTIHNIVSTTVPTAIIIPNVILTIIRMTVGIRTIPGSGTTVHTVTIPTVHDITAVD